MRRRKKSISFIIILMVLAMGIGYAYLSTTLSINGTTDVDSNSWDIHWDNIQVIDGSVTGDQVITAPTIDSNETTVSYHVRLKEPGDYYEFAVDAVNGGTIDAMVDTITSKLNNVVITTLPAYLDYSITYLSGQAIEQNHLLAANSADTYKVRVAYRNDIDPDELPSAAQSLSLSVSITYAQADSNATVAHSFGTDSWETIVSNISTGIIPGYYSVGSTKEVEINNETHTLRISNTSSPPECDNPNFSQTACGFVLEFEDYLYGGGMYEEDTYTNLGGWPATPMHDMLNDAVDLISEPLKSSIITTRVISGYGTGDSDNFVTYDKIYLFSTVEIYGTDRASQLEDTVGLDQTRQLDYYRIHTVNINSVSEAVRKKKGTTYRSWWLRTASARHSQTFNSITWDGKHYEQYADDFRYVFSPAFRIG